MSHDLSNTDNYHAKSILLGTAPMSFGRHEDEFRPGGIKRQVVINKYDFNNRGLEVISALVRQCEDCGGKQGVSISVLDIGSGDNLVSVDYDLLETAREAATGKSRV